MIRRLLFFAFFTILLPDAFSVCLPEWKYNRSITVSNSNVSALSNFQVRLTLNTQALILSGKMKGSGDDIRFTDAACNNLHYWIESGLNTSTTVIWVKVPSIPASGNSSIYLYYGNQCAAPAQNGDSTFIFFDDFLGTTLNTAKWNTYRNLPASAFATVGGGNINFINLASTDNIIRTVNTFPAPHRLESNVLALSGSYPSIALLNSGTFDGVTLFSGFGPVFNTSSAIPNCQSFSSSGNSSGVASAAGIWSLNWTGTNAASSTFPGGSQAITTTPAIAANLHAAMGLLCTSMGSMRIDWTRIRAYAATEPTAVLGTETPQGVQISFSPSAICPGGSIRVLFSKSGIYFNPGNIFTLQLSDASGNFTTPLTLSTLNDTLPDTMQAELPKTIAPGTGYKLRISSSSPSYACFSSDTFLTIHPKPNVSYTFPNDSQCYKNNRYVFTSGSTIASGSIDTLIWNWDDNSGIDTVFTNTIAHSFNPFYAYYYPKLTAISNLGCRDSSSRQVNIKESPAIKTEFNDTIQCFKGNFFIIQSKTSTVSGSIVFKSWDFGDGSPVVNNVDSLTHSYSSDGIYQVRQINTHSNGCADTSFLACLVNTHPQAGINTNDTDQCLNLNNFVFESASTITNGLPLINYWDMGDGSQKDQQDSVHKSYSAAADRTIRLITISDDGLDGCADTAFQDILINPMPSPSLSNLDLEKCLNYNSFRFIARSSISSGTLSHNWYFGDSDSAVGSDTVSHSYASDGVYNIKMTVSSNKGCYDSAFTSVTVRPSPLPSFVINNDTQCYKYHEIKAVSTSGISSGSYSEYWALSDGSNFTDVDSFSHSFTDAGNYQILLELTSAYNCKDTVSDSVYILPMPQSSFAADDEDQCLEGNLFTFTDNSVFGNGAITGNQWLFGDGGTAGNLNSVSHSYIAENAYRPALIVYADNGCFDTSFLDIKVYPHPGSDFLINDATQCVNNNTFVFTNNTFISEGGFTNRWFFGDGSPFVDALNATKKYSIDSTFIVRVVSFSDQGCTDTAEKTVTVFPKARTNFSIDNAQQCLLGNRFNFNSSTSIKSGSYTLAWQFGDGTFAGNNPAPQKTYFNVQTYTVRLISTSNEGCLDTMSKTVRTLPMPAANFTFNYSESCLDGNDFQFNASSTVSNGTPMSHNWYFGDNDSTINSTFAQHSYLTDGSYTVRLISSTNIGSCKDTAERQVSVWPMPVAGFTVDDDGQCLKDNLYGFNSTSTISSGTIDQYNWNFGDMTTSTVSNPSKTYNKVDSFRVSLIVSSNRGCIDSVARRVYVFPMPLAAFSISPKSSCLKGNSFAISNRSSITNGVISTYRFYYGNGDSSVAQNPAPYSYASNGIYNLLLRTTTDKGCWDTATATVTVNPNPLLDFSVDPVCLKDSSVFVNNSSIATGSITSWKWLFGNGRSSTLQSPKHKYKNVGSYDITLTAVTDKGCADTLIKTGAAVVNPNPKAGFYYTKTRSWENEVDIQYTDTSSGAVSWKWDFASMGTATDQNPKLFYTDTLTQKTTLVVTNVFGCRDTTSKIIFIAPDVVYYMPSAFTPNDDNYNETFKPVGLAYAINYKFIIFNRWGEILFSTDNPQIGWDGAYNGEKVAQDLYYYRLEFVGVDELRHTEKGSVMILR